MAPVDNMSTENQSTQRRLAPVRLLGSLVLALTAFSQPVQATTPTCPLVAARAAAKTPSLPAIVEDRTCLVDAKSVGGNETEIYDVRDRSDFLEFHVPNAQHSSAAALSTILRGSSKVIVIYDSGKFRSDAFLLCSRLRSAGFKHFKMIDGGIAAWAQFHSKPEKIALSRLADAEVSAALSDTSSVAHPLTGSFRSVLQEHRVGQTPAGAKTARSVFLADSTTPIARIEALLNGKNATGFFWLGSEEKLVILLHAHFAQDLKRVAGPAESKTCGAL